MASTSSPSARSELTLIFFANTVLKYIRVSERGGLLTEITFLDEARETGGAASPLLREARDQICRYLSGSGNSFDLPLRLEFSPFRMAVYRALVRVPFGETVSYGGLAARAGSPLGARAVGGAMNANPFPLVIPCHRVIAGDGRPGGFGAGLERKFWLLEHEGISLPRGHTQPVNPAFRRPGG